jgi:hypothetical protein
MSGTRCSIFVIDTKYVRVCEPTYPISPFPKTIFDNLAKRLAHSSSMAALKDTQVCVSSLTNIENLLQSTSLSKNSSTPQLSWQPPMHAKSTSTPPSPKPQNALQKSSDRGCKSRVPARTCLGKEVVEGWRRVDMVRRQGMVSDSGRRGKNRRRGAVLVSSKNMASLR